MVPTQAGLFKLLSARMTWLSQREVVLGQNIANADTPDYRPRDLRAKDLERLVRTVDRPPERIGVVQSHPGHIPAAGTATIGLGGGVQDETYEVSPDGNAVVLEEQMAKLATTALAYQTTANVYQKYLGMVRTALGTPR